MCKSEKCWLGKQSFYKTIMSSSPYLSLWLNSLDVNLQYQQLNRKMCQRQQLYQGVFRQWVVCVAAVTREPSLFFFQLSVQHSLFLWIKLWAHTESCIMAPQSCMCSQKWTHCLKTPKRGWSWAEEHTDWQQSKEDNFLWCLCLWPLILNITSVSLLNVGQLGYSFTYQLKKMKLLNCVYVGQVFHCGQWQTCLKIIQTYCRIVQI